MLWRGRCGSLPDFERSDGTVVQHAGGVVRLDVGRHLAAAVDEMVDGLAPEDYRDLRRHRLSQAAIGADRRHLGADHDAVAARQAAELLVIGRRKPRSGISIARACASLIGTRGSFWRRLSLVGLLPLRPQRFSLAEGGQRLLDPLEPVLGRAGLARLAPAARMAGVVLIFSISMA
jgi:hypothetical protein